MHFILILNPMHQICLFFSFSCLYRCWSYSNYYSENVCLDVTNYSSKYMVPEDNVGKNEGTDAEMLSNVMTSFKKVDDYKGGSRMCCVFLSSSWLFQAGSFRATGLRLAAFCCQPQTQTLLLILFWHNLMLARGRCILNSWKKNFLFTSIYSCLHFILLYLDEALIV